MATENTEDLGGLTNFSIQDTMEMGMGNQSLLEGLYADDSTAADPNKVTPIVTETDPPTPPIKPAVPKGNDIVKPQDDATAEEKAQALIHNLLGEDDDDDTDDDVITTPGDTTGASSEEEDDDITSPKETQFTALAKDLFKLGVFTKEEDEADVPINNEQEFLARFQDEKKKGAMEVVDNFLNQFGDDFRNAFDAIYVKGVHPRDYWGTYNTIVNFAELDLTQEDNQVKVIKQALADQGYDSEDIDTEVERLKSYGDLADVSAKHHKVLVKREAQKLQKLEEDAEQELVQKANIKNQYIKNVQTVLADKLKAKEFDGIPLNPKMANELQDFLLTDKWKTASGETLTDFDRTILDLKKPENHATKVKIALLLKILEKDPGLTTIQKTGVTKQTNALFSEVARQTSGGPKKTSGSSAASAASNWKL